MADPAGSGVPERKPRRMWWRILLALLALPVLFLTWLFGFAFSIFSMHSGLYILLWTGFTAALGILVISALYGTPRRQLIISAAITVLCLLTIGGIEGCRYLTVDRFPQVSDEIDWWEYDPFRSDSRVVKVAADGRFKISGKPPRVNAAYALYPLAAGAAQALYPPRDYDREELTADGSDTIYEELLKNERDLVFGLPPSKKQFAAAEKLGLAYEITPFAREAFVFFVNKRNPATNLTLEQIRAIYSGKITKWEEIGAGSGTIRAFQRNEGSGSQTMLQRIMGSVELMPPIRENRVGSMGGIINAVADYRNSPEALGFSFRFFATEMFRSEGIKLLSLDGAAPTRENIRNGSYPFVTDVCIVTVRPRDENTRRIVDFLLSPAGCELVEKSGYTSLAALETEKR